MPRYHSLLTSPHSLLLHLPRRFPRHDASVLVAGSFPITAAGQCRNGANASPASRFNPVACGHRNRRPQDSGGSGRRQHQMLCGTASLGTKRVSRFRRIAPLSPSPRWAGRRCPKGGRGASATVVRTSGTSIPSVLSRADASGVRTPFAPHPPSAPSPRWRREMESHQPRSAAIEASCARAYSANGSWIVLPSAASKASWFACAS